MEFRRWLSLMLIGLALRVRPKMDDSDKAFAQGIANICRLEAVHAWADQRKSWHR